VRKKQKLNTAKNQTKVPQKAKVNLVDSIVFICSVLFTLIVAAKSKYYKLDLFLFHLPPFIENSFI
jgi:hypothetical protein